MNLLFSMAKALAVTLALELVFALVWGLRREKLWMVVLMNVLTNPAANLLYSFMTLYLGWQGFVPVFFLEAAVILTEGLCCRDFIKAPWTFVILCNVFSYAAGVLLQQLF
ncbi:MAG: hypothetical protein J6J43_02590 [Oscillospiraceae bacterium]|nr:hypothetical protein [Oscillospiraceae bacterium]